MNKSILNKYFRKFGFEVHGLGYLEKLKKSEFASDPFLKQKEFLKTVSPVIIDAGANRGEVSQTYLDLFPAAKIYAFEPFEETYQQYRQRFLGRGNIKIENLALTETSGSQTFYINKSVDTNSLLKSTKIGVKTADSSCENVGETVVKTISLDEYCELNNIPAVDILKLDVQGGEFGILKGATQLLSKNRIQLIYSEIYFKPQYEGHSLFHEIMQLLYKYKFSLQDIYNPYYSGTQILWADALFIREGSEF